ncbi:Fe-S cluster assembly iron-binding protein IscA [Hathewaya limosa]|uniref:Fe-S cluster assembly iron-binding protein IscA n=1 Tax=Hathewaya limosa TaxID=1536 RepID=A0ABU0JMQ2_HATLI|nr:Fe-S cluster assembly iron-binding protein IscA [Hathewaya limosa]
MSAVNMSNDALNEFKKLLADNQIETDTVRLVISGVG